MTLDKERNSKLDKFDRGMRLRKNFDWKIDGVRPSRDVLMGYHTIQVIDFLSFNGTVELRVTKPEYHLEFPDACDITIVTLEMTREDAEGLHGILGTIVMGAVGPANEFVAESIRFFSDRNNPSLYHLKVTLKKPPSVAADGWEENLPEMWVALTLPELQSLIQAASHLLPSLDGTETQGQQQEEKQQ